MPSIIQAGNVTSLGLVATGATDGILELRSGTADGGAVAITVDAAQNIVLAKGISGTSLQVVSVLTTAQGSQALPAGTDTVITGLTLSITPKGANSKFLVQARAFGESVSAQDNVYNVLMNGVRVNIGGSTQTFAGLSMATQTYGEGSDSASTPEILTLSTLVSTSSVVGTPITFALAITASAGKTLFNNRCVTAPETGYEVGSSEIIITEIGA